MGVDPVLAGLLLRQRIGTVVRTERLEECATVGTAEVVALSAASVVEDLVAAVGVGDRPEPGSDLGNRGVPVDFFEGAVRPPAHGGGQAGVVVLVVVEAHALLQV